MSVYVVHMQRWGDSEKHSYILGVFDSLDNAIKMGWLEHQHRGGKYDPLVCECQMNRLVKKYYREETKQMDKYR